MTRQRTRTAGSTSPTVLYGNRQQGWYQATEPPRPAPPTMGVRSRAVRSYSDLFSDELTPGYFGRVRRGEVLPVNPASGSRIRLYDDCNTVELSHEYLLYTKSSQASLRHWSWVQRKIVGLPVIPGGLGTSLTTPVPSGVVADAVADMRRDMFNALTFAAEYGKTHRMLLGAIKNFSRRINTVVDVTMSKASYRSGRFKTDRRRLFEIFEEVWLEARYGWRPLLYDIVAVQAAYGRLADGAGFEYKRGASRRLLNEETLYGAWTTSGTTVPGFRYRQVRILREEVRSFALGLLDFSKPVTIDPLLTAYEVIPYSFVFDWFFDISTSMRAYSPFANGKLVSSGYTTQRSAIVLVETQGSIPTPTANQELRHLSDYSNKSVPLGVRYQFARVSNGADFDPPSFRVNLNPYKVVDLVLLLTQRAARRDFPPLRNFR